MGPYFTAGRQLRNIRYYFFIIIFKRFGLLMWLENVLSSNYTTPITTVSE